MAAEQQRTARPSNEGSSATAKHCGRSAGKTFEQKHREAMATEKKRTETT
jgi:hypothetical protein